MDNKNTPEQYILISGNAETEMRVHFRDLVETINEGIYCVNSKGEVAYANERFCKNLGYTIEEVIGKDIFHMLYDEKNGQVAKRKFELRKKGVADIYDIQIKTKSGEQIWVRMNGRPITNEKGEFAGAIAIATVVTEQRELEKELIEARDDLEIKVNTRTRQLSEANQKLSDQIKERRISEVSLRNSERRFRDIYNNSPDAIFIESYEGVIIDVNEAACKLHKCDSPDSIIGKTIYDISPVQLRDAIKARQPNIINGLISKFESEAIAKDGCVIPIDVSVAQIDFKGTPSLLMHVRDISDRKNNEKLLKDYNNDLEEKVKERTKELEEMNERMAIEINSKALIQQELQQQKDFLRLIIDSTPNLLFVKDQEGKFLLANKATAHFYGMKTEEMEGHHDTEYNFSPEELKEFKEQDEEVRKVGKEVQFTEQGFVNPETGKVIWLQTVKKPIPSFKGNNINILGVAADVTAIREAKEELRKSEQLYHEIARHLPKAAMFIFDKNLRFILAEGPLVGIVSKKKNEIEGKTVFETIRESEHERAGKIYRGILAGESSESDQDLNGRSLKVYHIPIRDEHGQVIYGMVMVFDISDLKETQTELEKRARLLERSNEELERFAYVASHDLQGPLRTIASYLQLLEMRYKDKLDTEALEFIDFSVGGAKRMQTLILDLLNYSRITSATKSFVKTDINQVLTDVKRGLESTIKTSKAEVIIPKLPIITAEPNQLYQLIQNLIDNGIKFVKDRQPVITITCAEREDEWEFGVADNGIGIKPEFKEKVFQIFQRLHNVTEYPGTGVGLAICKKIVQLHGGRIWFESEPDKGTTFRFTISKNLEND